MDFKLSYNWLKEFVDLRLPPEALADLLSLHSVSVERMQRMDEGLDASVVVGRIEKIEAHPNADKLKVAYVATHALPPTPPLHAGRGEKKNGFSPSHREGEREGVGRSVRVVCGGTNLREGMLVAFAPPGAKVRWHGQGELVELKPTDIRGVRSDGMICAASEIGLGEYFPQEGEREILDLTSVWSGVNGQVSGVGQRLAAALGLDDVVFDIEVTTNRPDLMSIEELAREVAAVTRGELRVDSGELSKRKLSTINYQLSTPRVRIEDRNACARYGAVVIDGVKVAPSPWWMQRRLIAAGLRPINNVVDVTNYVMLELGQPLHAFDAARLKQNSRFQIPDSRFEITVRRAKAGESLQALDGNTYALTPDVLVIATPPSPEASEGKAIALAGIMGGKETGVTEGTTRIVLECANFDPMVIRKGVRQLNVRTDASTRFEKGLQPEAIESVLPRAVELLVQLTGGTAGKLTISGAKPKPMRPITFRPAEASARIGVAIAPAMIQRTLTALGCKVQKKTSGIFSVTPPWWRRGDLEGPHDLVEEIARLYGYHRLPSVLPSGALPASVLPPRPPETVFGQEDHVRSVLAGAGATEVMTYSLTSQEAIERCGYAIDAALALENPLSEEFAYLRPSVLPTILPIIAQNQEHHPKGLVFEMGNVYIPNAERKTQNTKQTSDGRHVAGLPREEMRLCVAAYGRMVSGGHVMQLKGAVEHLFERLGIRDVEFRPSEQCVSGNQESGIKNNGSSIHHSSFIIHHSPMCLWHPGRTMDVVVGGVLVGVLGEVHPSVVEQFGISARVAAADLDLAPILAASGKHQSPESPPAFPSVKRDLAIAVDRRTPYADIAAVLAASDPLLTESELFDQYEGAGVAMGKKSLAFHLTYRSPDRTLTAAEVDTLQEKLLRTLRERFGAEARE
ncbi:MAG: phenylalanine--tRNA ligase subunit beta [bacterium]|nr:phenylalanine--tRNA ligase subunit beta [bacterium]